MRFDLKTPCKNCPFRTDETAIRFQCRERAEEIEELAYRRGFPCHLSADIDEDAGYEFARDGKTQHCAGALLMYLHEGESSTPGTGNNEDLFERLAERMDFHAPVFQSIDDFLDANTTARDREEAA
jgi:hypothetical protein